MEGKKAGNLKLRCIKMLSVIVIVFVFIIIIGILILKIGAPIYYHDFYDKAECEFEIPELSTGFVPQGFEYRTEDNVFLISGYLYKSDVSRVYIVEPDGSYKKIEIKNTDGRALISHSGGICSLGEFIYIASCDGKCYVLTADSVMSSETGTARIIGSFDTYKMQFFAVQMEIDYMLVNFIIRSVQGMCFTDNNEIVLSSSSIFRGSQLYCYDFDAISKGKTGIISIEEASIPLYYVDSSNLKQTIEVLPKSEGLAFRDGRVYMLFESASKRFKYGKLIKGDYVFSYDLFNDK